MERWSEMKRYGTLLTCLARGVVHNEVVASAETDSFIIALSRVIARIGNFKTTRSDNASNFIVTSSKLYKHYNEINLIF